MTGYPRRLPEHRPTGLRLSVVRHAWHRLDATSPELWTWSVHHSPLHRFDSATGAFRVRYAGETPRVAMRERFDASGRIVSESDLGLHLVELTGSVRVLDLRHDNNLDALGLDDRISTGRAPEVWATCHHLADLVASWYGERCHGIVYRSRTAPQRSANVAFFEHAPLTAHDRGSLRDQISLLAACVHADGFAVEGW
jgi:hypothetical protein